MGRSSGCMMRGLRLLEVRRFREHGGELHAADPPHPIPGFAIPSVGCFAMEGNG